MAVSKSIGRWACMEVNPALRDVAGKLLDLDRMRDESLELLAQAHSEHRLTFKAIQDREAELAKFREQHEAAQTRLIKLAKQPETRRRATHSVDVRRLQEEERDASLAVASSFSETEEHKWKTYIESLSRLTTAQSKFASQQGALARTQQQIIQILPKDPPHVGSMPIHTLKSKKTDELVCAVATELNMEHLFLDEDHEAMPERRPIRPTVSVIPRDPGTPRDAFDVLGMDGQVLPPGQRALQALGTSEVGAPLQGSHMLRKSARAKFSSEPMRPMSIYASRSALYTPLFNHSPEKPEGEASAAVSVGLHFFSALALCVPLTIVPGCKYNDITSSRAVCKLIL
eukprot:m.153167 g.153167  ORF g.153167 m.153167 type:complete len:343 (+) comp10173_c0_seq1:103-1131(+)